MIKTYKKTVNGEKGTNCDIKGSNEEVYNDFRAILNTCIVHPELLAILSEAIGSLDQELQDKIAMLGV